MPQMVPEKIVWLDGQICPGDRFNDFVVVSMTPGNSLFKCDCGTIRKMKPSKVTSGWVKSCGCRRRKHGHSFVSGKRSPEYSAWMSMKGRCLSPYHKDYSRYGGRGITICPQWVNDFSQFYSDMGARPEGETLDRIDNEKGYSPENCRWATLVEQGRNKSDNRLVEFQGKTQCVTAWAEELNVSLTNVMDRARARDWDYPSALQSIISGTRLPGGRHSKRAAK